MSSQLSRTIRSRIGSIWLTRDGLETGVPLLILLEEDYWSGWRSNGGDVLGGAEYQRVYIGGASGTKNRPVTMKARGIWDAVFWQLAEQAEAGDLVDAVIALAATDASGAERVLEFDALRWIDDLSHASAPTYNERFAARIYRDVEMRLFSEA